MRITVEPLTADLEEWQTFLKMTLPLEEKHLEIRVALRDAEAALRADPGNENLKAQVKYLMKRLKGLERQAPWLSWSIPREVLLWGRTWGC